MENLEILMEKLLIFTVFIGCCKLPDKISADGFTIGVLHDPTDGYENDISHVIQDIEQLYSLQSFNITISVVALHSDSQWTLCQHINQSSLALVAVGNCNFQQALSLAMDSPTLLPVVRVEMETPCELLSRQARMSIASSRYGWIPHVVSASLAYLSSTHLLTVFSEQYVKIISETKQHLSKLHVKHAMLTVDQLLHQEADYIHHMHTSFHNYSIPIFLVVSAAETELILSKYAADAHYWLVFCEEGLGVMQTTPGTKFYITSSFQVLNTSDIDLIDKKMKNLYIALHSVISSFQNLRAKMNQFQSNSTIHCGQFSTTVSTAASQLFGYLSQYAFYDHGFPEADHFDIMVATSDSPLLTGHWNSRTGLVFPSNVNSIITKTPYFSNKTLIIGTEVATPFVILENGTWKGFCIDMLAELAVRMGFQYRIVRSVDGLWGGTNPDGSWNGLVGMAIRGEIDMAIGPISMTAERETVVDFTKPYMESAAGFIMRRFEDVNAKMFRTLMPFTKNVWFTLGGLVIAVGIFFGIINRLSPSTADAHFDDSARWIRSMGDSAWVVFGSIMEQGADKFPRSVPGRIVLGLWWVFTILTTASYTASLAAFLTYSLAEVPINSIYDFAHQSRILPLVKNGTNLYAFFKKRETAVHRRLFDMMQKAPVVDSNDEALSLVMSGPYAFLTDREQLILMQKADCEVLVLAEQHFNHNGLGFFVPDGDPLLEPLSNNIIKLMEAGLIDKWRRQWWSAKEVCSEAMAVSRVQSLKLDSTAGPFILYAGTTVLAFLVLLSERAFNTLWPVCTAMINRRHLEQ